jgi:amino acid adenylation domain-containing protein
MPENSSFDAVPTRSVAADAPGRFVQLPTDAQRSATNQHYRALATSRPIQSTGANSATVVGALCAVLFRYTQQETIDIDLNLWSPHPGARKSVLLSCPVEAGAAVATAVAHAACAIAALPGAEPDGDNLVGRSNVAVTFVDRCDALTDVVPDSDTHEVHLIVRRGDAAIEVAYDASLFHAETIDRLADALVRVFEAALERPQTPIGELPVLSDGDLHAITVDWDSGHAKYPQEPVHRAFERLAHQHPEDLAASFEAQSLTYGELDAHSSQLAHHLIAIGVRPGDAVAVCVLPSLDIVAAFLAIWKAGAVYVPLDPTHPEALIAGILDEVRPAAILTQSALRWLTNPQRHSQFCFDTDAHLIAVLPTNAPGVKVTLHDRAYVLYTSGTTGRPKGVDASHANLAHYIHVARRKYGLGDQDVFCSLARYTFSISLFELVLPLCCGASVRLLSRDDVLAPNRLAHSLRDVTVLHAGPSLLGNLFRHLRSTASNGQTFPQVRHASSGGDLVPPTLVEEMKQVFENAELFVLYGCTEISCMGCTFPISRERKTTRTFVGKTFADVLVRVTDPQGNLVPLGATGEICFAGKGLVRGYLQQPELSAEKFVDRDGIRFYRTGDMGRLHPDGNIEFLGRRDWQVQIRGIRVELPGIENMVREVGLAEQCAVVVKKLGDQDLRLVAFVAKPRESTVAGFRRALSLHLPDYMLPQSLVVIDALPVTRNGKLDRNALQELPWENCEQPRPHMAPGTAIERQIADAFARTLGLCEVGIDDDLFDCGGHSLLAVIILQQLEDTLGWSLPPGLLFEHPTPRGLAAHAQESISEVARPILLSETCDRPPLYMLLGVQLYRPFARRLEGHYSVYGVYAGRELAMLESPENAPSVPELASDYVEIIRRQQSSGPYRLGGVSFGGIVAYEVAQQLIAGGAEVEFVGLIDAILPERGVRYRIGQFTRAFSLPFRETVRVGAERVQDRVSALLAPRLKLEYPASATAEKLATIDDLRQEAYARAAKRYVAQIRPFSGNVELIVAGRRLATDPLLTPDCGWRNHLSTLRPHVLNTDHLGLVEEPSVAGVAEIFLRNLQRMKTQSPHAYAARESSVTAWGARAVS